VLLALIALRARWRSGFSADGLEIGEALIGDYNNCGMTRREYRTRVERLLKWELITLRPTPKGTIAKLTSSAVFDINECPTSDENRPSKRPTLLPLKNHTERPPQRPTDGQQTANKRPLTKNERRKERKNHDDTRAPARTRETGAAQSANGKSSSSIWSSNLEEAEKDSLWPQFENYCLSNGGAPTLRGWNTWRPKQSTTSGQHTRSSGEIAGRSLPVAKRNKIINRLNERKQRVMRTFPDGKFAPWAKKELAGIQRQLEKL
jgi:hypothetical protein